VPRAQGLVQTDQSLQLSHRQSRLIFELVFVAVVEVLVLDLVVVELLVVELVVLELAVVELVVLDLAVVELVLPVPTGCAKKAA
jgi:hypothetical protein